MKKLIFMIIALISFSFTSCGQNDSQDIAMVETSLVSKKKTYTANTDVYANLRVVTKAEKEKYNKIINNYLKENKVKHFPMGSFISDSYYVYFISKGLKKESVIYDLTSMEIQLIPLDGKKMAEIKNQFK